MAHLYRNLGVSDMLWKGVYIVIFGLFRYCSRLFLARVFWHADTHRPPTSPSFNGAFPQKIGKGPPKSRSILVPSWGHVGRFVAGTVLQGQRWRNWGHIARSSTYGRYTSYVLLVASRDTLNGSTWFCLSWRREGSGEGSFPGPSEQFWCFGTPSLTWRKIFR